MTDIVINPESGIPKDVHAFSTCVMPNGGIQITLATDGVVFALRIPADQVERFDDLYKRTKKELRARRIPKSDRDFPQQVDE